jgi:hypothetical protein
MKFVRPQRGGISTDDDALSHHRVIGINRLFRITEALAGRITGRCWRDQEAFKKYRLDWSCAYAQVINKK